MTVPIVTYRPQLSLQPLDEDGDPDGDAVDVTCDMASVELGIDQPLVTVSTFCGKFQIPDDIEESATLEVTVNDETLGRWAPLVGKTVLASLRDRETDTGARQFVTQIRANPGLYGSTQPGQERSVSLDVPIFGSPEYVADPEPPE